MNFFQSLAQTFANKPIDWDELEAALIRADLGVSVTSRIIRELQEREAWSLMGISDVIQVARTEIEKILPLNPAAIRPLPAGAQWRSSRSEQEQDRRAKDGRNAMRSLMGAYRGEARTDFGIIAAFVTVRQHHSQQRIANQPQSFG